MTFFNDDLCPSDYLTDDEIDDLNENLDRQDLENSIPEADERNRYLTWPAQSYPAKISFKLENGDPI